MTIQLNSDNNLSIHENFGNKLSATLKEQLSRYEEHITRIEVHLSDENGTKKGMNDKRCLLEARMEGRQPIAVTEMADTHELAVSGAIQKLKHSLERIMDRIKNH
jgi:ribosome-associated translation inhibitor RaiA